jgi:TP901 family phage tail tape measure protein
MRFSVEAVFKAIDRFTRPIALMESRTQKFQHVATKGMLSLGKGAVDFAVNLGAVAVAAGVAAVAVAGIALSAKIVEVGGDFEAALSNVAAVSGATTEELAALSEKALELGPAMGFTGKEVVGAMESMAKSGYTTEQVMSGIGGVLAAAAADGGELADVGDGIMSAMKGLGLGPERMQNFADILAKAGDTTAASIGTLTESMAKFGPVAKQLGVPLEDAVAQLALLQDAGLDASTAGTSLASVYSKLAAPVGTTKKELKKLGISVKDAYGNMKPPQQLFGEILKATSGMEGNVDKMASITNLVGLESQKAMLNVAAAAGDGRLESLTNDLKDVEGYSRKIAGIKQDNFQGDMKKLGAAVDGVLISLFYMAKGPLGEIVTMTTTWVEKNKELIGAKFQTVANFIGYVAEKLPEWIPTIIKIAKFFAGVTAAVGVLIGVLLAAWAVLMATMFAPLIALIAAWAFFPDFFAGVWEVVKSVALGVASFFVALWDGIKSFFVGTWRFIAGLAILAWDQIKEYWAPQFAWFSAMWTGLKEAASGAWKAIVDSVEPSLNLLTSLWQGFKDLMAGVWAPFLFAYDNAVKPILESVGAFVDKVQSIGAGEMATAQGGAAAPGVVSAASALQREIRDIKESRETIDLRVSTADGTKAEVKRSSGKRGSGLRMPPPSGG